MHQILCVVLMASCTCFLYAQNNALHFDGVNDFVQIPHNAQIDFGPNENFTIELWVKVPSSNQNVPDGNAHNRIVEKWSGVGSYPYVIRYVNNLDAPNEGKIFVARLDGVVLSGVTSGSTPRAQQ